MENQKEEKRENISKIEDIIKTYSNIYSMAVDWCQHNEDELYLDWMDENKEMIDFWYEENEYEHKNTYPHLSKFEFKKMHPHSPKYKLTEQFAGHGVRVKLISREICDILKLSEFDKALCCAAAEIHDIGKALLPYKLFIASRNEIKEKEKKQLAAHPKLGYDCLINIDGKYPEVKNSVLNHHSTYDKDVYHKLLKESNRTFFIPYKQEVFGEKIPLFARIIQVADIHDALASKRAYKNAYPLSKVMKVLDDLAEKGKIDIEITKIHIENVWKYLDGPKEERPSWLQDYLE